MKAQYVWEHPYCKFNNPELQTPTAYHWSDPLFYVPLQDLEKGPATVTKNKTDDQGFWVGTLCLDDRKVEVVGFDTGPLKGLVKIPVDGIGTPSVDSTVGMSGWRKECG
jgi:hypothetical protein